MIILDGDTLIITTLHAVSFVSISQKAYLSKIQLDDRTIQSICVLGGSNGTVRFLTPPENVRQSIFAYVEKHHTNSTKLMDVQYPLRTAWIAVREGRLPVREACDQVISETNRTKSIDEWCFAHNILMEAVSTGAAPASLDYNGNELHWLQALYNRGLKLVMGIRDTSFVTSLFVGAEKTDVIA